MGKSDERTIQLRETEGENLKDLVLDLARTNNVTTVLELVCNSADALASNVYVRYEPEKAALEVFDDGEGMTPKQLDYFYKTGDSAKLQSPRERQGRPVIGMFGIATKLLKYMCRSYTLETASSGVRTLIERDCILKDTKNFKGKTKPVNSDEHYTRLTLHGVMHDEELNEKNIRRKIRASLSKLLSKGDFHVYVNGEEVQAFGMQSAQKFTVLGDGKYMGHISGTLYFAEKVDPDMAGISVYVHGRRVGNPSHMFHMAGGKDFLRSRVVGMIDANDLEKAIVFDRTRLKEDDPGFREFLKFIGLEVTKLTSHYDAVVDSARSERLKSGRGEFLERVRQKLITARVVPPDAAFNFYQGDHSGIERPGAYNKVLRRLLVNENYPALATNKDTKTAEFLEALMHAAVDAVAFGMMEAREHPEERAGELDEFFSKQSDAWSRIRKATREAVEIHAQGMYPIAYLANLRNRTVGGLRRAAASKLLAATQEGISGKDFLEFEKRFNGLLTLYDLVHRNTPAAVAGLKTDGLESLLDRIPHALEPFVYRIGEDGKFCSFVEKSYMSSLWGLLSSDRVDGRKTDDELSKECQTFVNSPHSMQTLTRMSDGLTSRDVFRITVIGKKKIRLGHIVSGEASDEPSQGAEPTDEELEKEDEEEEPEEKPGKYSEKPVQKEKGLKTINVYHFGDFVRVLQQSRGLSLASQ